MVVLYIRNKVLCSVIKTVLKPELCYKNSLYQKVINFPGGNERENRLPFFNSVQKIFRSMVFTYFRTAGTHNCYSGYLSTDQNV
jgi:hypothetical protein